MATATTTTLLVFLAPADSNLSASVVTANAESTVFEIAFPSNLLGGNGNGTVTVGPSGASTGPYQAQVSVPNTGEVTLNCNTSASIPTACVATGGLGGIFQVESTTIPSYNFLPVAITAGQELLGAASTASPSSTDDSGSPFSGSTNVASGRASSTVAATIAILAVIFRAWPF